jgi:hypothetical protein
MNATNTGELTPTKVANLAIALISECGSDPLLMKRVYETALTLVGAPLKSDTPTQVLVTNNNNGDHGGAKETQKSTSKVALTPEEAKAAKKQFREKFGLKSLTPEQAKMALKIARDAKSDSGSSKKAQSAIPDGKTEKPATSEKPVKKEKSKGSALKPDPNERKPRVSETTPYVTEGSRSTWNVKLGAHRQKAMERGVYFLDAEPDDPNYGFFLADYFNAVVTLKDTWSRFQNTWDCSGKKDPLEDLPKIPDDYEEIVNHWYKTKGAKPRKRETGQFILMDEVTATSLRPKN